MAVADATGAAAPAAARAGGRLIGALIGLAAVALTVALFISLGNIGLGLAPTTVLVLAAVPVFAVGAGAVRHISGRDRQEHKGYPLGLSAPSFAYYCAFFVAPMFFLFLFALSTRRGSPATRTASTSATSPTRSTGSTSRRSSARCAPRRWGR